MLVARRFLDEVYVADINLSTLDSLYGQAVPF